jgi:hypothetical protein
LNLESPLDVRKNVIKTIAQLQPAIAVTVPIITAAIAPERDNDRANRAPLPSATAMRNPASALLIMTSRSCGDVAAQAA